MHSTVTGTAHVKKGSCAVVNCHEQRDGKTNPYKSMKWGRILFLWRILLYLGYVERNGASSFLFGHQINIYFFILVHINTGKL